MGKTAIFYDSHIEKRGNTMKEASEKWDVKQSDTFPLISMTKGKFVGSVTPYGYTKEKLKNYDTLVFVSPNWQAGELSDEWKNAVILLKKSDLKSKKIALVGYDESLNICPAKTFRDKLKGSGAEYINKCIAPSEKYAGMAIDKADNEKTTTEEVKEATQEMNYNPNAHL